MHLRTTSVHTVVTLYVLHTVRLFYIVCFCVVCALFVCVTLIVQYIRCLNSYIGRCTCLKDELRYVGVDTYV